MLYLALKLYYLNGDCQTVITLFNYYGGQDDKVEFIKK